MALFKNIQYPNGTETNYHKIGEIRIVPLADQIIYVPKETEQIETSETEAAVEPIVEETESTVEVTETIEENVEETLPGAEEIEEEPEPEPTIEYEEVVVKNVSLMIQVLSYVSQEIRDTNVKNNLTSTLKYFTVNMEHLVSTDIMQLSYNLIKTLPEFEGAENI